MVSKINKNALRLKRHVRVRGKISGTPECPRLNVFRRRVPCVEHSVERV